MKPENILLDLDGHIKLVDFGLAKWRDNNQVPAFTACGTPEYVAPEVLSKKGYDSSCDWWSLGILLYEMYSSRTPFHKLTTPKIIQSLRDPMPVGLPKLGTASNEFRSLIRKLLIKNPSKRLKTAEDVMKHEFFNGLDWDTVKTQKIKPLLLPFN